MRHRRYFVLFLLGLLCLFLGFFAGKKVRPLLFLSSAHRPFGIDTCFFNARYVRLTNDRLDNGHVCEIEVFDRNDVNLAVGKKCTFHYSPSQSFVEIDLIDEKTIFSLVLRKWSKGQQLLLLDNTRELVGGFSLDTHAFNANCSSFLSLLSLHKPTPALTPDLPSSASQPILQKRWKEFRHCLEIAHSPCASDTVAELPTIPLPYEVLKAHFEELLAVTVPMRGLKPHDWAGYAGPWIENVFIAMAERANFSVFHLFYPLVPLFVQSVDACLLDNLTPNDALHELFRNGLRRDVMYVIILQADAGLCFLPSQEDCSARNVLALSSGGWGNVALPLIKGFISVDDFGGVAPPDVGSIFSYSRSTLVTSTASGTNSIRAVAHTRMSTALSGTAQFRHFNGGQEWKGIVHDSVLSMSPRGYGRTSYRMSELVQMGIPQIYIYDDLPWAPYWDPAHPDGRPGRTDVWGPKGIGYISNLDGLSDIADGLCAAMSSEEASSRGAHKTAACPGGHPAGPPFLVQRGSRIDRMKERALELAASHFTYDGVMQRIFEFIDRPWDADLLCIPRPSQRT